MKSKTTTKYRLKLKNYLLTMSMQLISRYIWTTITIRQIILLQIYRLVTIEKNEMKKMKHDWVKNTRTSPSEVRGHMLQVMMINVESKAMSKLLLATKFKHLLPILFRDLHRNRVRPSPSTLYYHDYWGISCLLCQGWSSTRSFVFFSIAPVWVCKI